MIKEDVMGRWGRGYNIPNENKRSGPEDKNCFVFFFQLRNTLVLSLNYLFINLLIIFA